MEKNINFFEIGRRWGMGSGYEGEGVGKRGLGRGSGRHHEGGLQIIFLIFFLYLCYLYCIYVLCNFVLL